MSSTQIFQCLNLYFILMPVTSQKKNWLEQLFVFQLKLDSFYFIANYLRKLKSVNFVSFQDFHLYFKIYLVCLLTFGLYN